MTTRSTFCFHANFRPSFLRFKYGSVLFAIISCKYYDITKSHFPNADSTPRIAACRRVFALLFNNSFPENSFQICAVVKRTTLSYFDYNRKHWSFLWVSSWMVLWFYWSLLYALNSTQWSTSYSTSIVSAVWYAFCAALVVPSFRITRQYYLWLLQPRCCSKWQVCWQVRYALRSPLPVV